MGNLDLGSRYVIRFDEGVSVYIGERTVLSFDSKGIVTFSAPNLDLTAILAGIEVARSNLTQEQLRYADHTVNAINRGAIDIYRGLREIDRQGSSGGPDRADIRSCMRYFELGIDADRIKELPREIRRTIIKYMPGAIRGGAQETRIIFDILFSAETNWLMYYLKAQVCSELFPAKVSRITMPSSCRRSDGIAKSGSPSHCGVADPSRGGLEEEELFSIL